MFDEADPIGLRQCAGCGRRLRSAAPASIITRNSIRGPVAKTTTCRACGRDFERFGRASPYAYCKRCAAKADKEVALKPRMDCRECGKAFSPKTRTVRYCSDACRAAAARRAGIERDRRRMADPETRARRLASARAWAAARRARGRGSRRPPPRAGRDAAGPRRSATAAEPYPCALCGRSFAPYGGGRPPIHCKRCAAKADKEIGRERTLDCKECGTRFTTPSRSARYCSKACRADSRRRVARELYHSRMADPEKRVLLAARWRAWDAAARKGKQEGSGRRPSA